jgi:hypothetical protein
MSPTAAGRWSRLVATAAIIAVGSVIAGCAKAPAEEGSLGGQDAQPAKLVAIPGSPLHRVVLTAAAVKQVGIETTPASDMPAPAAPTTSAVGTRPAPGNAVPISPIGVPSPTRMMEIIPVTAVIYDPDGASWTYTTPADRTYVRVPIVVDHIDGDHAFLASGPPVGTPVVSQGAPELLGVEYGVGEE